MKAPYVFALDESENLSPQIDEKTEQPTWCVGGT